MFTNSCLFEKKHHCSKHLYVLTTVVSFSLESFYLEYCIKHYEGVIKFVDQVKSATFLYMIGIMYVTVKENFTECTFAYVKYSDMMTFVLYSIVHFIYNNVIACQIYNCI